MYEEYPSQIVEEKIKAVRSMIKTYYFFGVLDFALAVLFLVATEPTARWLYVWAGNVMFIAMAGAYWITKAEDLKKKLNAISRDAITISKRRG